MSRGLTSSGTLSASRYLARQLSNKWQAAAVIGVPKAVDLDYLAEVEDLSDLSPIHRAWRKTQKAMRKAELSDAVPKHHRSIKADSVPNSSFRQAAKRMIE
mmetsp:Transcript_5737/g.16104  ORF Transcript_5737/g.16104 Transcript_5737/m.16104 type:complete len:101 (-) Transcript_5737:559-861(-)